MVESSGIIIPTAADLKAAVDEAFRNAHARPDTDADKFAIHHTLGKGANQAASGDHEHANPGECRFGFFDAEPTGWYYINGQEINRTANPKLFARFGITYGAGDGSTTFNLPNMADRTVIGFSGTRALGSLGGEANHTLTVAEMPSHRHGLSQIFYSTNYTTTGGSVGLNGAGVGAITQLTDFAGGDQPHNNMPPYLAMQYIIKGG